MRSVAPAAVSDTVHSSKGLSRFVSVVRTTVTPVIVDLGPVVGTNVTFFADRLGCRMRVEDLAADIDRHARDGVLERLPAMLASRFAQAPESVDGILCWDVLDYLAPPAAQALATALSRLLRPEGCLLGLFGAAAPRSQLYTKYVVVDESTLCYRTYPAFQPTQRELPTGEVIRLFRDLRVTDSFLLKTNIREMLFRKPASPV